jgi:TusA-related sulfurtransferase
VSPVMQKIRSIWQQVFNCLMDVKQAFNNLTPILTLDQVFNDDFFIPWKNILFFQLLKLKIQNPIEPGTQVADQAITINHMTQEEPGVHFKKELNLIGIISPLDLLKCKRLLNKMQPGEQLEVVIADKKVAENLITVIKRSTDKLAYKKKHHHQYYIGIIKGKTMREHTINEKENGS